MINEYVTEKVVEELIEEGFLCKVTRGNIIRISPPLIIEQKEINQF